MDLIAITKRLVNDESPQMRRELAIALRHSKSPEMPSLWAQLAKQHEGQDRWYIEALGIGAAFEVMSALTPGCDWLAMIGAQRADEISFGDRDRVRHLVICKRSYSRQIIRLKEIATSVR